MTSEDSSFLKPGKKERVWLTLLIVAFFSLQLLLSARSAWLQDDRYGWRMFHNVGFYKVSYSWVRSDGRKVKFVPSKKSIVSRGQFYIVPHRKFRASWYSDGTIQTIIQSYAEHMGAHRLPPEMVAFEARLRVKINDEDEDVEYVYRYPETSE